MNILILLTITASLAAAAENFNGPEWQEFDFSSIIPIDETPDFRNRKTEMTFNTFSPIRPGRIVGGEEARPHSHPYAVFLIIQNSRQSNCGGTVISNVAVLTAANCLPGSATSVTIIAGAHDVTRLEPTQQRRTVSSSAFNIHPFWNPTILANDIAVLKVPQRFLLGIYVQQIGIPNADADLFIGSVAMSVGWGRTSANSANSNVLRTVYNMIIINADCMLEYGPNVVTWNNICINTTGGRGICSGDIGGPLLLPVSSSRFQVGIASVFHGSGCQSGVPHVFTRLSSHRKWIDEHGFLISV